MGQPSGRSFKDELKDDLAPGASDDTIAAGLRDASKIVVMTTAAYNALAVKDPNTIYIVT